MHGWFAVFPPTEFWSRFPSCLAIGGAAAGVVVFAERFFPPQGSARRTALCAGVIFAILPRVTWAGIETRSSALSVAAAVWLTVLFVAAARRNRPRLWLLYALMLMVAILVNIYLVLLVPVYAAILALVGPRKSATGKSVLPSGWGRRRPSHVGAMTPFMLLPTAGVSGRVDRRAAPQSVPRRRAPAVFRLQRSVRDSAGVLWSPPLRRGSPAARAGGTARGRLLLASRAWIVFPRHRADLLGRQRTDVLPALPDFAAPAAAVVLAICIVRSPVSRGWSSA